MNLGHISILNSLQEINQLEYFKIERTVYNLSATIQI